MKNYLKILLIVMISGCYSVQKAEKEINKAQVNYPALVAKKSLEFYPCTYKVITDTFDVVKWRLQVDSIIKTDTIYLNEITLKECVDLAAIKKVNDRLRADISNKGILISNLRKAINQVPVVYKTVIVKDSAASYLLEKDLTAAKGSLDKTKEKVVERNNNIMLLLIILFFSLLVNLLQWKFRKGV